MVIDPTSKHLKQLINMIFSKTLDSTSDEVSPVPSDCRLLYSLLKDKVTGELI